MQLNADFSRRIGLHTDGMAWQPSPIAGVQRRMLDRIGGEVARATSIVRYDPASAFSAHSHGGGEEFVVLDGIFQDEHGDYPAGWYVRNPPTSRHVPRSAPGCTIFVKLWQFDPADRTQLRLDMNNIAAEPGMAAPGVAVMPLFADRRERVRRETWAPQTAVEFIAEGGAELLVLGGSFSDAGEIFRRHDWLRLPIGHRTLLQAGANGADLWIKSGHLRFIAAPATA